MLGGCCHDLLISADDHLTFSPYLPSLHSLVLQARYLIIHVNSQAQPLSALAISLFISLSLYYYYLLQESLQPLLNVPETSEICLQGWAAFNFTLTTSDAGSNIRGRGSMQVRVFIASIIYALNLLLHQPLILMFHILINI